MLKIHNLFAIIAAVISISFAEFGKIPAGWGDFRWGLVTNAGGNQDGKKDNLRLKTAVEQLGIKIDYRYRYVNEGVNPKQNNCKNLFPVAWNGNYSEDAKKDAGVEASYVIYMLQEDRGGREKLLSVINDPEQAKLFFWTLQTVAENANGHGATIVVEPDTWGYFLQHAQSTGGWTAEIDPSKIPARVNDLENFITKDTISDPSARWDKSKWVISDKEINFDHLRDLPNTMSGFGVAIIRTIHKFAPDAFVGFLASHWSVQLNMNNAGWHSGGLVWSTPALIDSSAKVNIEFFSKLYGFTDPEITLKSGDRADFIGVEKNGRCAGEWFAEDGRENWFWDDGAMENYLTWTKQIAQGLDLPVIGWQISIGNENNPNTTNKANNADAWKDTFFPYFFRNVQKFIEAGFIGFLAGKGLAYGTDYTLPGEGVGENGWFFNQLVEFDKGRPYYTKEDELNQQNTSVVIKNSGKNAKLSNVAAMGKTLKITLENTNNAEVSIFDISGRQILKSNISTKHSTIPLNSINSGIYFVKMEFSGKKFVSKVMLR